MSWVEGSTYRGFRTLSITNTPQFCDDYVHRVGRTGRMGREGVAFTFVTSEEGMELTRIEQRINRELKRDTIEGFDHRQQTTAPQRSPNTPPPPAPPSSLMRRPPKRHRRAL